MSWDTQEYIKYMLVLVLIIGVGTWLIMEVTGHYLDYNYSDGLPYIPSRTEPFSVGRHPKTIMVRELTDIGDIGRYDTVDYDKQQPLDMDILRSQRYYSIPEVPDSIDNSIDNSIRDAKGLPPSQLFSLTQEMPTTYMMDILRTIRLHNSSISIDTRELVEDIKNGKLALNKMTNMDHQEIQANDTLAKLFTQLRVHIVSKINHIAIRQAQSHPAHPFQLFEIRNSWNLGITKPQEDEQTMRFIINLILYRGQATHTFNIQAWIDVPNMILDASKSLIINRGGNAVDLVENRRTTPAYIQTLELVGSSLGYDGIHSDQRMSLPSTDGNTDGHTLAPLTTRRIPEEAAKYMATSAMFNGDAVNVNLEENTRKYLEKQKETKKRLGFDEFKINQSTQGAQSMDRVATERMPYDQRLYGPYKCFIVDKQGEMVNLDLVTDPQECQSYHEKYGSVGLWDKPCTRNEDCPFYAANTNSVKGLTLGGCRVDTGKCEMPEGVVHVGYRHYAKASKPRCYGCDIIANRGERPELEQQDACCEEQKRGIESGDIKDLSSPDYKFANDGRDRD